MAEVSGVATSSSNVKNIWDVDNLVGSRVDCIGPHIVKVARIVANREVRDEEDVEIVDTRVADVNWVRARNIGVRGRVNHVGLDV